MMQNYLYPFGTFGYWGGGLFSILLWIVLIGLFIWFLRGSSQSSKNTRTSTAPDEALKILRERYAKGEINKKEFDEKLKDLK